MRKLHTRRGGFTLIELMIVVAIIGILAAIAIPNFLKFQLRSKTGEAKTNLAAMRTAEEGYFAEYGVYIAAADYPGVATVSGAKQTWAPAAGNGFDTVGWGPEASVLRLRRRHRRHRVLLRRARQPGRRRRRLRLRVHPPGSVGRRGGSAVR
jgi:prepilin-type N-terminal cleavage/methylation domain-containing protein